MLGDALREAYGDLFVLRSNPTEDDRQLIQGKFKSAHNTTDRMADYMAKTFFALLELADVSTPVGAKVADAPPRHADAPGNGEHLPPVRLTGIPDSREGPPPTSPSLHYNIQIHLPATKDVEVYNAIFKSLREHLIEH